MLLRDRRDNIIEKTMETTIMGYIGLERDNGKENGSDYNGLYKGYIGIMEKNMETT